MPLCVTKFGKSMDPSQSFHVCSQLPAEKAKGSLPGKPIRLLREPLNRAEEEKARFQKEELFTIKANWVPHRHSVSYTKTKFWRSEVQNESHWAKIQELAGLCSLLEALRGRICFLALSSFQRPPACLGWWPLSSSLQRAERSAEYINCFGGKDRSQSLFHVRYWRRSYGASGGESILWRAAQKGDCLGQWEKTWSQGTWFFSQRCY
ncbi:uncharacterized protein LOC122217967 isoform X2 [Panthera leo]|uniref:uncharacterized protein LOC122217967 isoform X2 n=1 Tax=Panthera leo TaxID=9689 RepID=UPI001C6A2112|nr:uncharacterized protein LOC122217967 isoform X2 [Panthera leo]